MLVDGPNSSADMSSDSSVTTAAAPMAHDDPIDITAPPGMLTVASCQQQSIGNQSQQGPLVEYQHDPPDTKEGIEELCPVCGDKVSGYHYGLLTCESCKGFFKRTVQNKKVYTCVADRSCHIDKSQRKRCPYCRFQKCLDVGMKLEAVRADRMRGGRNKFGPMYKRDRARKLQLLRQKQIARAQCQGVMGNEVLPIGAPPFTPSLPAPPPVGMPSPVYSGGGDQQHIKQELIQIPQLSSSTSSPDSSPSQGGASAALVPAHYALAIAAGPASNEKTWSPGRAPSPKQQQQQPYPYDTLGPVALLTGSGKIPPLIREFQQSMPEDKDWQNQLFGLLQSQTYNQCEVDLFELMCKVIDQSLFAQVDWARNSIFFKELKVDDQMKLLQHSWSDMLILDHLHQRLHNGLPEETTMPNGQKFSLVNLALLGVTSMVDRLNLVASRLTELKFDPLDFICLKFLLLLNPDVRTLSNLKLVHEAYERAQQALMEYTLSCYPQITDKFTHLLQVLPEIHVISERGEDFLLYRHLNSTVPTQTLLMEMLHAKKK
ncbi:nuclear hormone receptor FTZ-F1-like [Uloborus diversus]|uniref:nuclear hormone receptor FTZ-F1-like n=1 Tax=Uloborus diversus TaxID=327109 RepID=UPI00240A7873|nr:nuclear hormone receptor FTZ-F1-like [Uloborus diversus]